MGESVSVVIPTHNRAAILEKTLESLAELRVPDGLDSLELVVVANACSDTTLEVVAQRSEGLRFPVRCVEEPVANLSVARNRGVEEARGAILAMLDDDVWVEPAWLEGLLEVYAAFPADLVAGRVTLWWHETRRPEWFTPRFDRFLSSRDHGPEPKELFKPADPLGANFSFRRELFDEVGGFRRGLGRTGTSLLGGEEVDFAQRTLLHGARMFYAPRATVGHLVPPERVTPRYLLALARGSARSHVWVESDWTALRSLRRMLSGASLVALSFPGVWYHGLRGNTTEHMECRIRRQRGLGRIQGNVERLLGRTPLERFATET